MKISTSFRQLWLGELPLHEAFWRWLVTYGLILNLGATMIGLTLVLAEVPIILAAIVHFLPLPYTLFAAAGAWRSASRYKGSPVHATAAKAAIVLLFVFLLII